VVVLGDKFKLTCAQLTAHLTNGHADIIIAITNVVINIADPQKGTNLITAERADYLDQVNNGVTNNTITLTGDPKISNDRGIQEAEKMVWDRQTGNLTLSGGHGILNHGVDLTPAPKPANSQAPVLPGTNLPPVVVGHTNQ
jgi:lipopolysaccharide export system protein LptA